MTRHVLAAATACLALTAGLAAPASGAVKRGTFAGTSSESDPVGFKVDRRGRVTGFTFDKVTLTCSDGDTVETPRVLTPAKDRFAVVRRKFGIEARNKTTGFGWDATGTFARNSRRATGTLRVFARFNERNEEAADGTIRCKSAALKWTARRR